MPDHPQVTVDKQECMSSGRCMSDIPEAFAFDDDELAEVIPGVADVAIDRLLEVARNCPGQAITVVPDGPHDRS
jgi:ferredoxin